MRLGDIVNPGALPNGKPLDGVRILALEQMQALPYATQLLARLGAEVVKIENPTGGDLGRGSLPAMKDPEGRNVGATFLRNNLNKRSVTIDLKDPRGRELVCDWRPGSTCSPRTSRAAPSIGWASGTRRSSAAAPGIVYVSVSGFGNAVTPGEPPSPYGSWPAYAAIAEAMSGMYEWKRPPDQPPVASPLGALGDIGSGMFAVIGVLAALRHRERTGLGQHVDIAMFDSMVAMADVMTNYWSMGERPQPGEGLKMILDGFRAADGWFIVQVGREHEFARLADRGRPPRVDRRSPLRHSRRVARSTSTQPSVPPSTRGPPTMTNVEACQMLSSAGVAAGPVFDAAQVIADPHVANRHMQVELPRTDGVPDPVLIPGNPVKFSEVAEGPETRVPVARRTHLGRARRRARSGRRRTGRAARQRRHRLIGATGPRLSPQSTLPGEEPISGWLSRQPRPDTVADDGSIPPSRCVITALGPGSESPSGGKTSVPPVTEGDPMKCPACPSSTLVMTDRSGIEIDYCPDCRGVWLDRGELDKIIERATPHRWPSCLLRCRHPLHPIPTGDDQPYTRRDWDDDDDDHHRRDHGRDGRHDPKRKRKGLLGELFDF